MRGGKREGAGRPKKNGELRIQRALRATSDEWQLILNFATLVKKGYRQDCELFLQSFKP